MSRDLQIQPLPKTKPFAFLHMFIQSWAQIEPQMTVGLHIVWV